LRLREVLLDDFEDFGTAVGGDDDANVLHWIGVGCGRKAGGCRWLRGK
jgi:hypothetical protein